MKVEKIDAMFCDVGRTCHRFTYSDGTVLTVYDGGRLGYGMRRFISVFQDSCVLAPSIKKVVSLIVGKGPLFSETFMVCDFD